MKKKLLKWFIVLLPLIAIVLFFVVVALIPNRYNVEEKINTKDVVTKDSRITFVVDEKYTQEEKGEYDLYLNKDKSQIIGVFTYNLSEFEENSGKEVLDKQISSFIANRKDMQIFKKELAIEDDAKKITKVEYSGKTESSDECIYIFSVIEFKNDPNYIAYVTEVIAKNDYEDNIGEMVDILKNVRLN